MQQNVTRNILKQKQGGVHATMQASVVSHAVYGASFSSPSIYERGISSEMHTEHSHKNDPKPTWTQMASHAHSPGFKFI